MKRFILAGLCLALVSSPAFAKGPQSNKQEKHENKQDRFDRDRRDHGRKDHDRERQHASARPAGWDKGKKTGWGNCDVPPGQAKKEGCHPGRREHRRQVTYRRDEHRHDDRHNDHRIDHRSDHRNDRRTTGHATRPVYTHHPAPRSTTSTATTTTTTTTTKSGQHPFAPTLRQKQEGEARLARTR